MKSLEYQETAVTALVQNVKKLLTKKRRSTKTYSVLLKAPTGAGKTVMLSEVISQIVGDGGSGVAFLWLAPNSLHDQSYLKLQSILRERGVSECHLLDEMTSRYLPEDSISFVNWASISGDNKKLRRRNESGTSLEQIVQETKEMGLKLVAIVDESHHSLKGPEARAVVEGIISPHMLIEVTATPVLQDHDEMVTVHRDEVVKEHVIRKGLFVNPLFEQGEVLDEATGEVTQAAPKSASEVLDAALEARQLLAEKYEAEVSAVRPLVLVQVPEKHNGEEKTLDELRAHLLIKHSIQESNGRLAIWLAENKVNHEDLVRFDSPVEVLFFKQGIALGWDCPRAQILVSLREMKSPSFTSQVLGRIMRQPELMEYSNDTLNYGYVFANHEAFSVRKELESIRTTVMMKLNAPESLQLPNHFRLNADTGKQLKRAVVQRIHDTIKKGVPDLKHQGEVPIFRVAGLYIEDIDLNSSVTGTTISGLADLDTLEVMLDQMVADLIKGTADQLKGKKYVLEGLLGAARDLSGESDSKRLHEVLLHPNSRPAVYSAAMGAVLAELESTRRKGRALEERKTWCLPNAVVVRFGNKLDGYSKCRYGPVYGTYFDNQGEADFAKKLEEEKSQVTWWLKNGRSGKEHFSIKVGSDELFFPDWIVRYADGHMGIYDTKAHGKGASAATTDAQEKSDALQAYLKSLRKSGMKVKGGLVVLDKTKRWRVFTGKDYQWSEALADWDNLF